MEISEQVGKDYKKNKSQNSIMMYCEYDSIDNR